jgi:hypothetical protein
LEEYVLKVSVKLNFLLFKRISRITQTFNLI